MKVYMDNGATTKVMKEVVDAMVPYFDEKYGNPSSLHYLGLEAHEELDMAREVVANGINADASEIFFTSGGTESDNIAIFGATYGKKGHIITTKIEHSAVKKPFERLSKEGWSVTWLKVDKEGFVDIDELEKSITKDTVLVSVIHANHEIGTIQDISRIGEICRKKKVLFHTDACQSFTKVPIDVKKQNVDLLTLNGHKIHGPKGVGALYIRKGVKIHKHSEGGPHENNIRPGTENLPAIIGFSKAAEIGFQEFDKNVKYVSGLRDRLNSGLLNIPHTFLNGAKDGNLSKRLLNNVDITFKYIEGEAILLRLSMEGICVSTGSACSSKSLEPSHILTAIGLKHADAHGSIRFSLSKFNTEKEVDYVIDKVREVVKDLRKLSAFAPED